MLVANPLYSHPRMSSGNLEEPKCAQRTEPILLFVVSVVILLIDAIDALPQRKY